MKLIQACIAVVILGLISSYSVYATAIAILIAALLAAAEIRARDS